MAGDDDVEKTIAEDLVVTKYKMAAEIVQSKCPVGSFNSKLLYQPSTK